MIFEVAHPKCALLQQLVWLASASVAAGVAASINSKGTLAQYTEVGAHLLDNSAVSPVHVVRREHERQAFANTTREDEKASEGALLDVQARSGSAKFVILFLLVGTALVGFCAAVISLVRAPLQAMAEERAFEQAAKNAFLTAAPRMGAGRTSMPAASTEGVNETADLPASAQASQIQDPSDRKQEKLAVAWKTFLDSPIMATKSDNLLYVILRKLFEQPDLKSRMEDLFDDALASNPEGATLTGPDKLSKKDFEVVLDNIEGRLRGLAILGTRIDTVRYDAKADTELAVAAVEDYNWLWDEWDVVFTEQEPFTKTCFPGVICLVLAWNAIRTLHTTRHMRQEHRGSVLQGSSTAGMQFVITAAGKQTKVEVDLDAKAAQAASFQEECDVAKESETATDQNDKQEVVDEPTGGAASSEPKNESTSEVVANDAKEEEIAP